MNGIVQANNAIELQSDNQIITNLQKHIKDLNKKPQAKNIKVNKFANNSKYLPISFIQMRLDAMFLGLWQTKNFRYQVIANEIVGSIDLEIFHPIAKTWITRTGAAAVQIQMTSKEKGGSGDITNIRDKITNTLTKDFPHLQAACLTNAARSIGKIFGRDLNRKDEDEYFPFYPDSETSLYLDWQLAIKDCQSIKNLMDIYNEIQDNDLKETLKPLFAKRKQELQNA